MSTDTPRDETMWFCPPCETWVGWKRETCAHGHSPPRRPLRAADVPYSEAWKVTLVDRLKAKVRR